MLNLNTVWIFFLFEYFTVVKENILNHNMLDILLSFASDINLYYS